MKPRITDVDVRKPNLITAEDIARDVERFLTNGGQIEKPEFRRDRCQPCKDDANTRLKWHVDHTPPGITRELQRRGKKR